MFITRHANEFKLEQHGNALQPNNESTRSFGHIRALCTATVPRVVAHAVGRLRDTPTIITRRYRCNENSEASGSTSPANEYIPLDKNVFSSVTYRVSAPVSSRYFITLTTITTNVSCALNLFLIT